MFQDAFLLYINVNDSGWLIEADKESRAWRIYGPLEIVSYREDRIEFMQRGVNVGTTIAGVHELEKSGVRNAFINAVIQATKRADELSKL